jgi:predicted protein tyrosine phosphatase
LRSPRYPRRIKKAQLGFELREFSKHPAHAHVDRAKHQTKTEETVSNNRAWNCANPYQGKFKRVLCVCSAGLLRSPTVAWVLSNEPYNFNTRAVGIDVGHALIPLDDVLIKWADEIVCMDEYQEKVLRERTDKPVINLRIGDNFEYRDKALVFMIRKRYEEQGGVSCLKS